jgi:hypothetical protein
VGLRGLEPLTSSLSGKRSNRLSYRPVNCVPDLRKPAWGRHRERFGALLHLITSVPARRPRLPQPGTMCSVGFPEGYLYATREAGHEVVQGSANGRKGREQDGVDRADQRCVLKHA